MRAAALAALMMAAALGAACGGEAGGGPRAALPTDNVVIDAEPTEVTRIEISGGGRHARLVRVGRRWRPDGATPAAAATALLAVERSLFPLQAYRRFSADDLDPLFGLEQPTLALHVLGDGARTWSLEVGGVTPTGGGYYARRPGSNEIYILARASFVALLALVPGGAALAPPSPPPGEREPTPGPEAEGGANPWLRQAEAASTGESHP